MSVENRINEHVKITSIPGLYKFEWPTYKDSRGEFQVMVVFSDLELLGIDFKVAQFQRSDTVPNGLRGLHPEPMKKIVAVCGGEGETAIVDFRPESPTFLKFEMFRWGDDNRFCLFIPQGCANSISNTGKGLLRYVYLQDVAYRGKSFPSIWYKDPALAIPWTLNNPILSKRDSEEAISAQEYLARRQELNEEYLSGS